MASTNISFDQIPASIRKPGKYFEFNTTNAVHTLAANSQKRDLQDPQPLGLPHPVRRGQRPAHLRGRHRPAAVGEGKEKGREVIPAFLLFREPQGVQANQGSCLRNFKFSGELLFVIVKFACSLCELFLGHKKFSSEQICLRFSLVPFSTAMNFVICITRMSQKNMAKFMRYGKVVAHLG